MSEEKTVEARLDAIEKRLSEVEKALAQKADRAQLDKDVSDIRRALKSHRL